MIEHGAGRLDAAAGEAATQRCLVPLVGNGTASDHT
jgi:hypothetical protein